jgi:hypothetical protein
MTTQLSAPIRLSIAALGVAAAALGASGPTLAGDGGPTNCVDVTGKNTGRVGCYEDVWVDGTQIRMTFSNQGFDGATPKDLDPFYVIAPQTDRPQGPMASFPHDHVVGAAPAQNRGAYSTKLQGFFVLCSGQGIASGACESAWLTPPGGSPLPFAHTVDGQQLTSSEAIEAAAAHGDLALIDLGPSAVIVGSLTGRR